MFCIVSEDIIYRQTAVATGFFFHRHVSESLRRSSFLVATSLFFTWVHLHASRFFLSLSRLFEFSLFFSFGHFLHISIVSRVFSFFHSFSSICVSFFFLSPRFHINNTHSMNLVFYFILLQFICIKISIAVKRFECPTSDEKRIVYAPQSSKFVAFLRKKTKLVFEIHGTIFSIVRYFNSISSQYFVTDYTLPSEEWRRTAFFR